MLDDFAGLVEAENIRHRFALFLHAVLVEGHVVKRQRVGLVARDLVWRFLRFFGGGTLRLSGRGVSGGCGQYGGGKY